MIKSLGDTTNHLKVEDLLGQGHEILVLTELQTDNQLTVAVMPFAGADLRAVLGHPQHEVLFVASDVVKMAGLHKNAVQNTVKSLGDDTNQLKLQELLTGSTEIQCLSELQYQGNWKAQRLFSESLTYQMLLRGHAKESEPFRKWVTEEVLPSIRKTGRYDMAEHLDSEILSVCPAVAHYVYNNDDTPQNSLSDLS